ncbi:MAG: hypothetical protein LCH38_14565 [Proteobacteria bacterium]|nr:hypothetical protein [Pseudomonadota bacterium]
MARSAVLVLSLALLAGLGSEASAWTPPGVGRACNARDASTAYAGNFLGGKTVRDGIVNRLSFQGCFTSRAQCENWLADKATRFPVGPGFARCTPVALR